MHYNRTQQDDGEQGTEHASGVGEPGEQPERCRTGKHSLHQQNGQQQRTLPEVTSLSLPKEESGIACCRSSKECSWNEQPAQEGRKTEHTRAKPRHLDQAKDG